MLSHICIVKCLKDTRVSCLVLKHSSIRRLTPSTKYAYAWILGKGDKHCMGTLSYAYRVSKPFVWHIYIII